MSSHGPPDDAYEEDEEEEKEEKEGNESIDKVVIPASPGDVVAPLSASIEPPREASCCPCCKKISSSCKKLKRRIAALEDRHTSSHNDTVKKRRGAKKEIESLRSEVSRLRNHLESLEHLIQSRSTAHASTTRRQQSEEDEPVREALRNEREGSRRWFGILNWRRASKVRNVAVVPLYERCSDPPHIEFCRQLTKMSNGKLSPQSVDFNNDSAGTLAVCEAVVFWIAPRAERLPAVHALDDDSVSVCARIDVAREHLGVRYGTVQCVAVFETAVGALATFVAELNEAHERAFPVSTFVPDRDDSRVEAICKLLSTNTKIAKT